MDQAHAPTKERLTHGTVEPGFLQRQAHRAVAPIEEAHKRGDLDKDQLRAGLKFEKHYYGMMGADVRDDDTYNPDPIEYPRFFHGERLWHAAGALSSPAEYAALKAFIIYGESLDTVGRTFRQTACRKMARAQGLTLVSIALDALCYHWGIKQCPGCSIRKHYDPG